MKYSKEKFWFINDDGSRREPKNGDLYANREWVFIKKFPFLKNDIVMYELFGNVWFEMKKHK